MAVIAAGLAHERRVRIVRLLMAGRQTPLDLQFAAKITPHPFRAHLAALLASGFAVRSGAEVQFAVPDYPLAKALAKLIRQGATR